MAEANTPPAGGITLEQVNTAIATALKPVVDAIKPVAEAVAGLTTQVTELKKAPETKKDEPLTLEKVLGEVKSAVLGEVKNLLSSHQQSAQQTEARKAFVAERMKDLPAAYQGQLGSDPTKWAQEEQKIREQYQADFKITGGKTKDVGGDQAGKGQPAGAAVDLSKKSPVELIEMGLSQQASSGAAAATK